MARTIETRQIRFAVLAPMLAPLLWAPGLQAEVIARTDHGFQSRTSVVVSATPQAAYERALRDVARWWDPAHTYSGNGANLSLDARAGGCFCERLDGGGGVQHLVVVYLQPGKTVRLLGGLGPLQGLGASGALTWQFEALEGKTRITWTYRVTGLEPDGVQALATVVDQVVGAQVVRLGRLIDTGQP